MVLQADCDLEDTRERLGDRLDPEAHSRAACNYLLFSLRGRRGKHLFDVPPLLPVRQFRHHQYHKQFGKLLGVYDTCRGRIIFLIREGGGCQPVGQYVG